MAKQGSSLAMNGLGRHICAIHPRFDDFMTSRAAVAKVFLMIFRPPCPKNEHLHPFAPVIPYPPI